MAFKPKNLPHFAEKQSQQPRQNPLPEHIAHPGSVQGTIGLCQEIEKVLSKTFEPITRELSTFSFGGFLLTSDSLPQNVSGTSLLVSQS